MALGKKNLSNLLLPFGLKYLALSLLRILNNALWFFDVPPFRSQDLYL